MIVAGVLSGTSLDGIDVAVVDVRAHGRPRLLTFATVPFAVQLRERLLRGTAPQPLDALTIAALHADVGEAFGAAVARVASGYALDLVASHGVTLAHDGARSHTLQIGDPFRIREATAVSVAYDFRSADCAAGGTGAPLVPMLDALLFADENETRIALNLGGIANLTVIPPAGRPQDVIAFDSGPANLPLDTYVRMRGLGGADAFDRDGALAARGTVEAALLAEWLANPYFAAAPPKSAGREEFGEPFVQRFRARLDALAPEDALATLAMLTVQSVARAVERAAPPAAVVIASGGGVHNLAIMDGLQAALPRMRVERAERFGMDSDAKEAILFAMLGHALVSERPANVPRATGARGSRVLGALAPHDLAGLVAAVRREEMT
ncbi:MAG: anhydro-N-acetylmuramic acid kinase [Candidatus Velthaea sp.]